MSALSSLQKFRGSTHNTKALGRGRGSGKGGTSTKGGKGQKARKGTPIRRGFEGGQTPLIRRMPKVGFSNTAFRTEYDILNLNQLQAFSGSVGPEDMSKAGLVGKKARVKILGRGDAPKGLTVRAHKFSESAKTAIEKAGGKGRGTVVATGISIPTELRKRILYTLGVMAIYRLGVHVPVPGVDANRMVAFFETQSSGIFGMFNTFTGGALERFSVFALGIMPYISSSIIFQLLQTAVPYLEQLKKEGEPGRKKINQYTRYGTIALALVQGYAMSSFLQNAHDPHGLPLVTTVSFGPMLSFRFMTILTLTAGTCFIMWLGEMITEQGIGNGSSLIIFAGIAAGLPNGTTRLYKMVSTGEMNGAIALAIILAMVAIIAIIVFLEVGQRRIPIQYSQRAPTREGMAQSQQSHLPMKINFANVIPPIFASSLLMFPATMSQFVQNPYLKTLADSLHPNHPMYNLIFVALNVFFCFFYTEVVFNPVEVADNLKKYGGFIPGIRAGKSTAEYVKRVLDRLTVSGAIYLSGICLIPTMLIQQFKVPFYFGGTSILILVGVALDTSQQIQSHLLTARYEGLLKGSKFKNRRVQF